MLISYPFESKSLMKQVVNGQKAIEKVICIYRIEHTGAVFAT